MLCYAISQHSFQKTYMLRRFACKAGAIGAMMAAPIAGRDLSDHLHTSVHRAQTDCDAILKPIIDNKWLSRKTTTDHRLARNHEGMTYASLGLSKILADVDLATSYAVLQEVAFVMQKLYLSDVTIRPEDLSTKVLTDVSV